MTPRQLVTRAALTFAGVAVVFGALLIIFGNVSQAISGLSVLVLGGMGVVAVIFSDPKGGK